MTSGRYIYRYWISFCCLMIWEGVPVCSDILSGVDLISAAYSPKYLSVVVSGDEDDKILRGLTEISNGLADVRSIQEVQVVMFNQSYNFTGIADFDLVLIYASDEGVTDSILHKISQQLGGRPKGKPRIVIQSTETASDIVSSRFENMFMISYIAFEAEERSFGLYKLMHGKLKKLCNFKSGCSIGPASNGEIRVTHDEWYPMMYPKYDGSGFTGISWDLFELVAAKMNLTPVFVPNVDPGTWGILDSNMTWRGMIGMIFREEVDLCIVGAANSVVRSEVTDFSHNMFSFKNALFAKRATNSRANFQNYLYEFDRFIWTGIVLTSMLCAVIIALILKVMQLNIKSSRKAFVTSLVLRALINIRTDINFNSSISFKVALLVLFGFTLVLNVAYKGCLNSFLAVVIAPAGIQNLEDVYSETNGLTIWPGGLQEAILSSPDATPIEKRLYKQFKADKQAHITNYQDGLRNVRSLNYALLAEDITVSSLPEYDCDIVQVDKYTLSKNYLSYPGIAGSKFMDQFNHELLKLLNQGIVHRLIDTYFTRNLRRTAECQSNRVDALGYMNVLTPFGLVLMGSICAIVILTVEVLFKRGRKILKKRPKKEDLIQHDAYMKVMKAKEVLFSAQTLKLSSEMQLEYLKKIVNENTTENTAE